MNMSSKLPLLDNDENRILIRDGNGVISISIPEAEQLLKDLPQQIKIVQLRRYERGEISYNLTLNRYEENA